MNLYKHKYGWMYTIDRVERAACWKIIVF